MRVPAIVFSFLNVQRQENKLIIVMEKNIYETPSVKVIEVNTKNLICDSNTPNSVMRGGYGEADEI